jgi:hypothetical protein
VRPPALSELRVFNSEKLFRRLRDWNGRGAQQLNSELTLDFSGAPLFAVFAKGGCFRVFLFPCFCSFG